MEINEAILRHFTDNFADVRVKEGARLKLNSLNSVLLTLFLLLLFRPAAAQNYTVTDLGTLPGGNFSEATAINNLGHVTGTATTSQAGHAFFWRGGKMRDLGGGAGTMSESEGMALNNHDGVVGVEADGEGDAILGSWMFKPTPRLGEDYGIAYGVNNAGEVAGETHDYYVTMGHHPFAGLQELGGTRPKGATSPEDAEARAINNNGLVVGSADVSANPGSNPHHAILWSKGIPKDLGTLGGTESRAYAVNDRGLIVGSSSLRPSTGSDFVLYHAFQWVNRKMRDLGALPGDKQSNANAINAHGDIVGTSGERGCVWRDGKPYDLNALVSHSSGWILQEATGINDKGQIVGNGLHHGKRRGYLLTPKL